MAFQFSVLVRNARLDAVETQIGTAAVLKVFSGAEPVDCAAADPAGLLATEGFTPRPPTLGESQ